MGCHTVPWLLKLHCVDEWASVSRSLSKSSSGGRPSPVRLSPTSMSFTAHGRRHSRRSWLGLPRPTTHWGQDEHTRGRARTRGQRHTMSGSVSLNNGTVLSGSRLATRRSSDSSVFDPHVRLGWPEQQYVAGSSRSNWPRSNLSRWDANTA